MAEVDNVPKPDDRENPEGQAMIGVIKQMEAGLNEGSVEKVAGTFWNDGVVMAPGYDAVIGKAGINAAYTGLFSAEELAVSFTIQEVKIMNIMWGFVRTTMSEYTKQKKTGKKEQSNNQELFILKKKGVGWKIQEYCFNTVFSK